MPTGVYPHKPRSEITREKLRVKALGRKPSRESREKMSRARLGKYLNKDNPNWKADNVKYGGLHYYVKRYLPKPELCEKCNSVSPQELANITGMYNRDLINWAYLCKKCHRGMDMFVDTTGWVCTICGDNKTTLRTNGKPEWRYLPNGDHICTKCRNKIRRGTLLPNIS